MKTLKEELQQILDEDKLCEQEFICINLSRNNRGEFQKYREMASSYAEDFYLGLESWWHSYGEIGPDYDFVISEKYRFIQDLIKILP